ncbi:hypothetical protein C0J52_02255 [Blattella germanica]|nr:hypothetical protein C0J52_02255 [Blattella germanica]
MACRMEMEDNHRSISPGNDIDGKKRLRCTNFSSQEKNILIHIIEKYQDVIECKKTDKISVQEREKVWEGIAQEFNEILLAEPLRTSRQLKMCYENLKRRIRKEVCIDELKTPKQTIDPIAALRSQILVPSDVDSSTHLNTHQGSSSGTTGQFKSEPYSVTTQNYVETSHHQPRRKNANIAKLRRILLTKEINLINMDLEMKAKKYDLEMKVEEAKLEYYRRKIAMLDNPSTRDS